MSDLEILKPVGYDDKYVVEYYIWFNNKYYEAKQGLADDELRNFMNKIMAAFKYIASRKRKWTLLFFKSI